MANWCCCWAERVVEPARYQVDSGERCWVSLHADGRVLFVYKPRPGRILPTMERCLAKTWIWAYSGKRFSVIVL